MKFFTAFEIVRSVYLSLLFGIFLAALYKALFFLGKVIKHIFILPRNLTILLRDLSVKNSRKLSKATANIGKKDKKINNVYDAIVFIVFGILFTLHIYITLDGIFRLYVLLITISAFVITDKTAGKAISVFLEKVFSYFYTLILLFCGLSIMPMYKTGRFMTKIIQKLTKPLKKKYQSNKSKKLVIKKTAQVMKLMEEKYIYILRQRIIADQSFNR